MESLSCSSNQKSVPFSPAHRLVRDSSHLPAKDAASMGQDKGNKSSVSSGLVESREGREVTTWDTDPHRPTSAEAYGTQATKNAG